MLYVDSLHSKSKNSTHRKVSNEYMHTCCTQLICSMEVGISLRQMYRMDNTSLDLLGSHTHVFSHKPLQSFKLTL